MDYYAIGQRIRKFRKAHGFSQEYLAEQIGISVTHMSHIETGNTKLSLPVLVDLATILDVHTDDLLYDNPSTSFSIAQTEVQQVLEQCNGQQARIIADLVKASKSILDKHL